MKNIKVVSLLLIMYSQIFASFARADYSEVLYYVAWKVGTGLVENQVNTYSDSSRDRVVKISNLLQNCKFEDHQTNEPCVSWVNLKQEIDEFQEQLELFKRYLPLIKCFLGVHNRLVIGEIFVSYLLEFLNKPLPWESYLRAKAKE